MVTARHGHGIDNPSYLGTPAGTEPRLIVYGTYSLLLNEIRIMDNWTQNMSLDITTPMRFYGRNVGRIALYRKNKKALPVECNHERGQLRRQKRGAASARCNSARGPVEEAE